jgi:capsular exopolysaccharide synthesis family protein
VDLGHLIRIFVNRRKLVAACLIAVTGAALIVSLLQTPEYQAQSQVLVANQNTGTTLLGSVQTQSSSQERDFQTQVGVLQSRPIADAVITSVGLDMTAQDLLKQVAFLTESGTNIATIEVTDTSPDRAAQIANAFADSYVAWSRDLRRASIRAAVDDVEARLSETQQDIARLESQTSGTATADEQVSLEAAKSLYATLSEQLVQLQINEQLETGSGSILATASPDPEPVSPKPLRDGIVGLALGLVLGLGAAFVAENLDNTIKSADEAEQLYGAPVLGQIGRTTSGKDDSPDLSVFQQPDGLTAESYRVLRNGLDFVNFEHDVKVVLVTSAVAQEGKSTVAANLAGVLAQAGKKTVLVECDFRRPTASKFFGLRENVGLSDVLTGAFDAAYVLQRPEHLKNLWVLTAGRMPPNPSELLGSASMKRLFDTVAEWADWIIVDSAPLLSIADTSAVARWADGVLMVTASGFTTREMAKASREMLQSVGARLIGIVVRGVKERAGGNSPYTSFYTQDQK